MRTAFGSWDMVAAKWVLGLIPSEALPRIATDALEAGLDSPSLRELAGDLHQTLDAASPLFEEILDEIGVGIPDRPHAGLVLARACAAQITGGTLSPIRGGLPDLENPDRRRRTHAGAWALRVLGKRSDEQPSFALHRTGARAARPGR